MLLSTPAWQRWTVASFLARLPQPMSLLAFQLAGLQLTGSLGKGALLVGITGFCGLLGPWSGRRRDRGMMRRRLQGSCVAGACALTAMAACVQWRGPYVVLVVLAVAQGSAIAGTWAGFRALLVTVTPERLLYRAHFVESFMVELSFSIGPLLVTGIAVVSGITVVLLCMAAAEAAGAAALWGVPDLEGKGPDLKARAAAAGQMLPGSSRTRPVLVISVFAFSLALGFSIIESNVPARMAQYGSAPSAAGTYMAVLAAGSCLGGLLVSFRPLSRRRPARQAAVLFGLFGLLSLPSALAASPLEYLLALLANSLMLVPLNGLGAGQIEHWVGRQGRGEAFGWFNAAMRLGSGLGATLNGILLPLIRPAHIPLIASAVFLAMPVAFIGSKLAGRRNVS